MVYSLQFGWMGLIQCSLCEHLWAQCAQASREMNYTERDPAVLNKIHFEAIGDNSREKIQEADLPIRLRAEAYTCPIICST